MSILSPIILVKKVRQRVLSFLLFYCAVSAGFVAFAQQTPAPAQTGFAVKKPIIAASRKIAPWGSIAEIFKKAIEPYGWDIQICYNCSGGPEEARHVFNARVPGPLPDFTNDPALASQYGPPPKGPVDFGVTTSNFLWWAYQGTHQFVKDGPHRNLRLIGMIQNPMYLFVAAKKELGITDLSQIKQKRWPVRILMDYGPLLVDLSEILEYYGLSKESIESAGGHVGLPSRAEERSNFDVIIMVGGASSVPEFSLMLEASQKYNLNYIQLPDDLLDRLAKSLDMERHEMPAGLLRGLDRRIPTLTYNGNAIYGRTDMPDQFAYDAAKALDEHKDLFLWALEAYSYDPATVWKVYDVPVHPGAARYYREKRYMNPN
jgi:uncharacterized protein